MTWCSGALVFAILPAILLQIHAFNCWYLWSGLNVWSMKPRSLAWASRETRLATKARLRPKKSEEPVAVKLNIIYEMMKDRCSSHSALLTVRRFAKEMSVHVRTSVYVCIYTCVYVYYLHMCVSGTMHACYQPLVSVRCSRSFRQWARICWVQLTVLQEWIVGLGEKKNMAHFLIKDKG